MSAYAYGQSSLALRPVVADEGYRDPSLCGRRIRAYRGGRARECARRGGHPGPCRPARYVAAWGGRYKPKPVAGDGRCRRCRYLPGSPGCLAACGEAGRAA